MTTKAAKQQRLPGTEDPEIEELHDAAFEYAGIRDQRMALTPQETEAKAKVLALMKKYKKQTYNHNGISIEVISEEETVRVKVKKEEPEEE